LLKDFDRDPEAVLRELMTGEAMNTSPDHVFTVAEVAYLAGRKAHRTRRLGHALDLYGICVTNAYNYLLSEQFDSVRNPYDPQFRQASDLYNTALESALRIVHQKGQLRPGAVHVVATPTQEYELHIVCRGPWHASDISELKFVSDYELQGLTNNYHTYGLGVPLIAVHSRHPGNHAAEQFYAPGMSVPVTAFLRVLPHTIASPTSSRPRRLCVLELHDPMLSTDLNVSGRLVPLETDLSIPLAHSLNDPAFKRANIATRGLLNPAESQQDQGLYLLEPYDPDKIPVLMVHGLWSNLVTWMEMFNDLRGVPEIRDHFQFWFYLYPSGQPLLLSATQLRNDLAEARQVIDPHHTNETLDQMVLVGHSMGGLIARLQTLESGEDYWRLMTDTPVADLDTSDDIKASLENALFFAPNRSIKRVVTIASPHRGSAFSNQATRWLGRRFIHLPEMFVMTRDTLLLSNRDELREHGVFEMQTSIDSLSPTSPILNVMQRSESAPWVRYHNIIGIVAEEGVLSKVAGESDGVVTVESARLDGAASELVVTADHINIHRHPRTVLEVQRILLEHLDQTSLESMQRLPAPSRTALPATE
jgi:pimeloyl-ACP methyl ester carboxylesterase